VTSSSPGRGSFLGHETKLYAGIALLFLGFFGVLSVSYFSLEEVVGRQKEIANAHADALILAERLNRDSAAEFALLPLYVLSGDPKLLDEHRDVSSKFELTLKQLRKGYNDAGDLKLLDDIDRLHRAHQASGVPGVRLKKGGVSSGEVHRYFQQNTSGIGEELRGDLAQFVRDKRDDLAQARLAFHVTTERILTFLIVAAALMLFFMALVSLLLVRLIQEKREADQDREKLLAQEKKLSQIRKETVEVVAHDLKNPLAGLKLRLQLMLRKAGAEKELRSALDSVGMMEKLIGDLLDHTKIEAGHLTLSFADTDVNQLLKNCVDGLELLAREKAVDLILSPDPRLPHVSGDSSRLCQVVNNLVGNAIKFTPAGGRIEVACGAAGDQVRLTLKDSGPGIAPEKLPHVFERFWQDSTTEKLGTGLGLAIAKGIVEAHGGKIEVASAPGRGCEFSVLLPKQTIYPTVA
jgi:signal transduction histidine kinase